MNEVTLSFWERFIRSKIQHYDERKYWKYRRDVVGYRSGLLRKLICTIELFYIKKSDAFNNASLGTHIGFGATFGTVPNFPHGLYGIIVSHNAVIGEECTIFHQVTIGEGKGGAPRIGNHVLIVAGAKIIGGVCIGDNVKIAAGSVVMRDIPDNAIVFPGDVKIKIKGVNDDTKNFNHNGDL